ncbi:hypothetical protein EVAR_17031_1 [Eumeta japonica]|uniref:Uncharacterized protein n=1 Tax=Eumeta variegata TaxID=151549 RepID=A0A4C1V684_EUMVA|nr:hypothetical protein EVAR_17031_1 [Eumeta japonica]
MPFLGRAVSPRPGRALGRRAPSAAQRLRIVARPRATDRCNFKGCACAALFNFGTKSPARLLRRDLPLPHSFPALIPVHVGFVFRIPHFETNLYGIISLPLCRFVVLSALFLRDA